MATLAQLEDGLRKADAAGNADDARAFAAEIRRLRQGAPDFSAVTGGARVAQPETSADPTEGMSTGEKFAAGFGRSFAELGRGLKQNATDAAIGLGSAFAGAPEFRAAFQQQVAPIQQQQQNEINDARALDAPLLNTGAGSAGNITGVISQILGPGIALRSTRAGAAFLPTTITGNAAQGAVLGGLQPTVTGESQLANAALGGAAGGAGAALFRGLGAGVGAVRNAMRGPDSVDRAAANVLTDMAERPADILNRQPSAVPGVQRTLAEETLDPGIARLERNMRSTSNEFDTIDRSNNAARVAALQDIAGDETALRDATRARSQATMPLLGQAYLDKGVDIAPIQDQIRSQISATAARPSVQSAVSDVANSLNAAMQNGGDVFQLYQVRKYIGDLLSGKAGADKSYARAATRELKSIQNTLDEQLAKASPSFESYLNVYRDMSVPINRMQIGQQLAGRSSGGAVQDAVTGAQVLTPAQFSKAARSLDDVAAKATGFRKAKASDILSATDISTIKAIQDDLERQAFRATAGSGGGSPTFERLSLDQQLGRRAAGGLAGQIPIAGPYVRDLIGVLDRTRNDRVKERLAYLVANPDEARRVLQSLPASGRSIVEKALTQISGATAAGAAVAARDDGLELDIVGGTPVPADQF